MGKISLFLFSFMTAFAGMSVNTYAERPKPISIPAQAVGEMDTELGAMIHPFSIQKLSGEKSDPYYYDFRNGKSVEELLKPKPPLKDDKNGFPMITVEGEDYYHPVRTAQYAIHYINSYKQLKKNEHLQQAEQLAVHLYSLADSSSPLPFLAYQFPFSVQGQEKLSTPWYSGMSQGQALSVYVRLYQVTKKPKYQQWAEQMYQSLQPTTIQIPTQKPWVTAIDPFSYLWIEEYPTETAEHTHVLNGYIFAIYGLYDYYQMKPQPSIKKFLQASLTTILAYGDRYRLPGELSYYSLKYNGGTSTYHPIHIRQLNHLYKITNDQRFADMSKRFANDTQQKNLPKSDNSSLFTEKEWHIILNGQ